MAARSSSQRREWSGAGGIATLTTFAALLILSNLAGGQSSNQRAAAREQTTTNRSCEAFSWCRQLLSGTDSSVLRYRNTSSACRHCPCRSLAGELNLALVTAPPQDAQIAATPFAQAPLYAALLETHPANHNERLVLSDLAKDNWILFARRVHPTIHDAILDTASREGIPPRKPTRLSYLILDLRPGTSLCAQRGNPRGVHNHSGSPQSPPHAS
jgi:LysR substrate binding domain